MGLHLEIMEAQIELPNTYVGWSWKANSIPTINTDGTIQSIVSANANSGFSILKYTGNGNASQTVGHGLSAAPELIIAKANITSSWVVYSSTTGTDKFLELNDSAAEQTSSNYWGTSSPSATTFGVAPSNSNNNSTGNEVFAYCFASISGFSKIGTYTGTGGSNRSITGLGFQPAWVMIKATSISSDWSLFDSSRGSNKTLAAQANAAEVTDDSNGYLSSFDSDGFTTQVGSSDDVNVNNF